MVPSNLEGSIRRSALRLFLLLPVFCSQLRCSLLEALIGCGSSVKLNPSRVAGQLVLGSQRLLAISNLLRKGSREFDFLLHGKSMAPTLPDSSWIRVLPAEKGRFTVGQVLTYASKDRVMAHRLVRSMKSGSTEYLITRGDATVCCDWPVPATSVLGTVIAFSTGGLWQPVGPPPERGLVFRSMAFLISNLVGNLLRVSPRIAVSTAKRIIRIHGMVEKARGYLKRRVALGSGRGVAL